MKAWQIDDPDAYQFVRGLRKAIRTYFETRNDTLADMNDMTTIIERRENLRAWKAVSEILYGNVDISTGGLTNENVN